MKITKEQEFQVELARLQARTAFITRHLDLNDYDDRDDYVERMTERLGGMFDDILGHEFDDLLRRYGEEPKATETAESMIADAVRLGIIAKDADGYYHLCGTHDN